MPASSIGFGSNPFGAHPYGIGDWAEEVLYKNIPEFYREQDDCGPPGSRVQRPLRGFIDSIKPSFTDLLIKWNRFPTLWDANAVPLEQLPALAYNVGITVDSTKLEGLQRSSVLNASALHLNKGNDKGYEITAAFEGLLVDVTPLWAESCAASTETLGNIGDTDAIFDLSTTPLALLPVSPGAVRVVVTTALGIEEDFIDDGNGNLVGSGNQQNGPLTKILVTRADVLELSGIVGLISIGDTVTQGVATGTVLDIDNGTIKVETTAGAFTTSPPILNDVTSGATATIDAVTIDVLDQGETIIGVTSGTKAIVRSSQDDYILVDKIDSGIGFILGETIDGLSSDGNAVVGVSTPLIQGPLRHQLGLTGVVGAFIVDELVTGGTSGATAFVREIDGDLLFVDVVTSPGFEVGEIVTGFDSGAIGTIDTLSQGIINYLTGELSGKTVPLQAGSSINSVVDFALSGPDQFVAQFDAIPGDSIPMDLIESDEFAQWPNRLVPVRVDNGIISLARCRSYSLRLFFRTPNDTEIEDFIDVAPRIISALERVRPLHVRFDKIRFDGARASSQVWRTGALAVESSAASTWTVPVAAEVRASSQVWTMLEMDAEVET